MGDSNQQLVEMGGEETGSGNERLSVLQVQSTDTTNTEESGGVVVAGDDGVGESVLPMQLVTGGGDTIDGQEALLLQSSIEVNGERHLILQQGRDPNTGEVLVFLQGENGETIGLPPEAVNANILQMGESGEQVYTLAIPQDSTNGSMVVFSDASAVVTSTSSVDATGPELSTSDSVAMNSTGTLDIPTQAISATTTALTNVVQSVDTPLVAIQSDNKDVNLSEHEKPITVSNDSETISVDAQGNVTIPVTTSSTDTSSAVLDSNQKEAQDKVAGTESSSSSSFPSDSHGSLVSTSNENNTIISDSLHTSIAPESSTISETVRETAPTSEENASDGTANKGDQPPSPMDYGSAVIQVQDAGSNASLESLVANAMASGNDGNYVIMATNDDGSIPTEINLADIINAGGAGGQTIYLETSEGLVACQTAAAEDGSFQIITDGTGSTASVLATSQGADNQLVPDYSQVSKSYGSIDPLILTEGAAGQSQLAASKRTYSKKTNIVWINPELSTASSSPSLNTTTSNASQSVSTTSLSSSPSKINNTKLIESTTNKTDISTRDSSPSKTIKPSSALTVTSPVSIVASPRQVQKVPELSSTKTSSPGKAPLSPTKVPVPKSGKDTTQVSSPVKDTQKAGENRIVSSPETSIGSPRKVTSVPIVGSVSRSLSPSKNQLKPDSPKKIVIGEKLVSLDKNQNEVDKTDSKSDSPTRTHGSPQRSTVNHDSGPASPKSPTKSTIISPVKKRFSSPESRTELKSDQITAPAKTLPEAQKSDKGQSALASKSPVKSSVPLPKTSTSSSGIPKAAPSKSITQAIVKPIHDKDSQEEKKNESSTNSKKETRDTSSKIARLIDRNEKSQRSKEEEKTKTAPVSDESDKNENTSMRTRRKSKPEPKLDIDHKPPEPEMSLKEPEPKEKSSDTDTPRSRGRPPKRKAEPVETQSEVAEAREGKRRSLRSQETRDTKDAKPLSNDDEKSDDASKSVPPPSPVKKKVITVENKKEKKPLDDKIFEEIEEIPSPPLLPKSLKTPSKPNETEKVFEEQADLQNKEESDSTAASGEESAPRKRGRPRKTPVLESPVSEPEKSTQSKTSMETRKGEEPKESTRESFRRASKDIGPKAYISESIKDSPKVVANESQDEGSDSPAKKKRGRPKKTPSISEVSSDAKASSPEPQPSAKKKVCFDLDRSKEIVVSEDDYPSSPSPQGNTSSLSVASENGLKKRGRPKKQATVNTNSLSSSPLSPILKPPIRTSTTGGEKVVVSFESQENEDSPEDQCKKLVECLQDMRSPKEFYDFSASGCAFHVRHQSSNLTPFTPRGSTGNYVCQKCGFKTTRMNNLVLHHKDQCPVVRLHWQNEINRQAKKSMERSSTSMERLTSAKRARLEEPQSSAAEDSQDDMDLDVTVERQRLEAFNKQEVAHASNVASNTITPSDIEEDGDIDVKESTKKKFGFEQNDIVWTKWSDVHWPALVVNLNVKERTVSLKMIDNPSNKKCVTTSIDNVLTFNDAERNKKFLREGKALMGDPMVKAVQKAEDYSRKLCLGDESGAAKLFGSMEAHYDSLSDDGSLINEKDCMGFGNHKDSDRNDDNDSRLLGMESDTNDDFLDFQATETIAQLKERRRAQNAKLLECIKEGKIESHLLGVYKETIPSNRHIKFKGSETEKSQLQHVTWFGPIDDDDQQEELYDYCSQLFKNNFKPDGTFDAVAYLFEVWIPEAIVKAISKVRVVDMTEAEAIFSKGVILSRSERDDLEKEIKKETERKNQLNQNQEPTESNKPPPPSDNACEIQTV
ncbi:uncharacterized protein LOC141850536 isoform X2 [Brevipalpus obovatus]|uniref:uncharacterized protein LOC141850536 isoform X2 n=1 Tax=Brevipalpus obovatus TaxID=246614 RepID=UPI003D9EEA3E